MAVLGRAQGCGGFLYLGKFIFDWGGEVVEECFFFCVEGSEWQFLAGFVVRGLIRWFGGNLILSIESLRFFFWPS